MKLASYLFAGKPGYGVMLEEGIIDLSEIGRAHV